MRINWLRTITFEGVVAVEVMELDDKFWPPGVSERSGRHGHLAPGAGNRYRVPAPRALD